jgi:hypothetical protein
MNEQQWEGSGKIESHGNPMGVPSPDDIEKRAREIALIDERDPENFTDADWAQARREMSGEVESTPPEEDDKNIKLQDEWEVTPDDRGHRVPRPGVEDDDGETLGGHLVEDGIDEASRDQMLEARREEREQEDDIT